MSKEELREANVSSWRDLMPSLRLLSFNLRDEGKLEVLQKGEVVTKGINEVTGPIRIRKVESLSDS